MSGSIKGVVTHIYEEPLMSYGINDPVYLSEGFVSQYYPDTGTPGTWYDAVIRLDLDGDPPEDVEVTRSIIVPSGEKYFLVKYNIENINGSELANFRLFQGVDYDAGDGGTNDEGGYAADFVWEHDLDDGYGTYVGFTGDTSSAHHSVDYYDDMWDDLETGSLNDAIYNDDDPGVGMEWDFGALDTGESVVLTVKFAFADTYNELEDILVDRKSVV